MQKSQLDLLIEDAKRQPRRQGMGGDIIDSPRMLDTVDEFITVAEAAIADMLPARDFLEDCRRRGCRTHLEVWRPHAIGYVGCVSNGRWWAIVQNQIRQMISDLQIRQYNADWRLASAKFSTFFMDVIEKSTIDAGKRRFTEDFTETSKRTKTRFFLLGVEIIDVKNTQPARYGSDSMPVDEIDQTTVSPDVRALLEMAQAADIARKNQAAAEQTVEPNKVIELEQRNSELASELSEVKAMLQQLINANIAQAAASIDEPAAKPAAKRRRSRKKAKPAADADAQLATLEQSQE